jgi:hypothetical protein
LGKGLTIPHCENTIYVTQDLRYGQVLWEVAKYNLDLVAVQEVELRVVVSQQIIVYSSLEMGMLITT